MKTEEEKQASRKKREEFESEVMKRVWPDGVYDSVVTFLKQADFDYFRKSVTVSQASSEIKKVCHLPNWKIREINVVVRSATCHCKFWRKRLKPERSDNYADNKYWDQLKSTVDKLSYYLSLEGSNTKLALRLIRTKISTNKTLMRGLPERLRVWEK